MNKEIFQDNKSKKVNHDKLIRILSQQISKFSDINFRQSKKISADLIYSAAILNSGKSSQKGENFDALINILSFLKNNIKECENCHSFLIDEYCDNCESSSKKDTICIVENLYEFWRMKDVGAGFNYDFHIIGGIISINNGFLPSDLNLESLKQKIENSQNPIKEVIIAINKSYDGVLTCNYIASFLRKEFPLMIENSELKITTLANGLPSGSSNFDFIDNKTLQISLETRREIEILD
jgi:recombination protein RecR